MKSLGKLLFEQSQPTPAKAGQSANAIVAPAFYTASVEETPAGQLHTVQWTDNSRFQFHDPKFLRIGMTLLAAFLLVGAASSPGSGMAPFGWLAALGAAGVWLFSYLYERSRSDVRTLAIAADGTITLLNPPPRQVERPQVVPGFEIPNGLSRITSIEYTKTHDWLPLNDKRVFGAQHWYDIHMFVGNEWRISISRNYGTRDHAHQITAYLNRLRAELLQEQRQAQTASQTTVA